MSKNSIAKKIKRKLVAGAIAFGLALASFTGLTISTKSAFAYDASSGLINNYNFKETSSSATPPTPKNWTKISSTDENIVSGVYSSYLARTKSEESYLEKFMLLSDPGIPEGEQEPTTEDEDSKGIYRSLLINSPKYYGHAGYESNSFTLEKDSYYEVHITVMTIKRDNPDENTEYSDWDSRASMYLMDKTDSDNIEVIDQFEMVNTSGKFSEYVMYIATNESESITGTIQLYLGGRHNDKTTVGAVLFNSAQIVEMDAATYNAHMKFGEDQLTSITNLRDQTSYAPLANSSFEDHLNGWTTTTTTDKYTISSVNGNNFTTSDEATKTGLTEVSPRTNNSSDDNKHILFMYLSEAGTLSLKSEDISIRQHGYYKLNVWTYAVGSSGSSTLSLQTENDDIEDATISVSTSSSSDSLTNNWIRHTFYIYGNAYADSTITLTITLNADETGYVFVDDISMQQISGETYESNKSNSNCTSFSLNQTESDYKVSNYEFDNTLNADSDITYPLAPSGWTASLDNTVHKGGVINTDDEHYSANKHNYSIGGGSIPQNPGAYRSEHTNNNVLMIGSTSSDKASFVTNDSIALSASTTYKLSLWAYGTAGGIGIKVYSDNYYLFAKNDIATSGWTQIEIFITTGLNSEDVYIELSQNKKGYSFFDKVVVEDSNADEVLASDSPYKVNLTSVDFENTITDSTNSTTDTNMFVVNQSAEGANSGIIDLSQSSRFGVIAPDGHKYVMFVESDNNCHYNVISNFTYALSSGSYYKVEALVYTLDLSNGAYFGVSGSGFEKAFDSLDVAEDNNFAQWTTYSIFIKADKDTDLSVLFGLGNSDNLSSGVILIDNVKFEKLDSVSDETAFNELVNSQQNQNTVLSLTIEADEEEEETTTDNEKDKDKSSFNWALIPSLITALALLIALVGTLIRKANWKGHTKVKTTYDRRKTLEKDMDRRERIALRQQIIAELNDQILAIDREIEEYKQAIVEQEKEEQEKVLEQQRAYIEKKQAITAEKEQLLRERNEKLAKDKNAYTAKAEAEFNAYIRKLELQEQKQQHIINSKEASLKELHARRDAKLAQYLARKEKIKEEIARVDAEIEAIAREEAQIWEEYKQAKADAKRRKAEYKAQIKQEKEERKQTRKPKKTDVEETKSDIEETKSDIEEIKTDDNNQNNY